MIKLIFFNCIKSSCTTCIFLYLSSVFILYIVVILFFHKVCNNSYKIYCLIQNVRNNLVFLIGIRFPLASISAGRKTFKYSSVLLNIGNSLMLWLKPGGVSNASFIVYNKKKSLQTLKKKGWQQNASFDTKLNPLP